MSKLRRYRSFTLVSCLLVLLLASSFFARNVARAQPVASKWTVMVYLDADCNLETYGVDNFIDMAASAEDGPGPNSVNVLVQMDRYVGAGGYGGWTDTKRFEVFHGSTPEETDPGFVSDLGEQNMGDPATLTDFVSWARSYRPADRYMLVLWNHGSGWKGTKKDERSLKGVCFDDTNGGDFLDMKALRTSLDTITAGGDHKVDLLTFDACLMGMAEIDSQIDGYCKERAASEETEPGAGIPYNTILADLVADPAMDESRLGATIVDRYHASYPDGQEYSAVDLAKTKDLDDAVGELSMSLQASWAQEYAAIWKAAYGGQHFAYWENIDLYTFAEILKDEAADADLKDCCQAVMDCVNAEVTRERHGEGWPGAHGVSIYFAASARSYDSAYDASAGNLSFTIETRWDEVLKAFLRGPGANMAAAANGGRVVDFSSELSDSRKASNLIDGGGACWCPQQDKAGNFVTVELAGGRPVPLGVVMIDPGPMSRGVPLEGFHLESSLDGVTFKTILKDSFEEEQLNSLNRFDLSGSGERARFLRLVVDSSMDPSSYLADVGELEVYRSDAQGARTFYFAEGTTRPGFDTYLTIENPAETSANVRISYMRGDGTGKVQTVAVKGGSRATVHPADVLGVADDAAHDFSALVESTNGVGIVAERPMYFDYKGKWNGGHDVIGATSPDTDWYFAEGTTRPDFDPYLSICNPGTRTASVKAVYFKGDGKTAEQMISVPAASRGTLHPADVLGVGDDASHDFSIRVASTNGVGIVAERPEYFAYRGTWTGGSDVIGANAPAPGWYFAEGSCRTGFEPYICIQNPADTVADVHITYMRGNATTQTQTAAVGAHSRSTISVRSVLGSGDDAACDFSTYVSCTNGNIICERPMYFDFQGKWNGGHDVVGATAASSVFNFAEGTARPGFEAYLSIQNPGDKAVNVTATYLKGDGRSAAQSVAVAARSRATLHPADVLGTGDDAAHDFSVRVTCDSGRQVIVERPMYFDLHGWTGGSDAVGFQN
jgi:hypothetical protein